ncbi:ATP-binding protein [Effusibacillus dendaii]|uniref:histidine kinase n=1 Tax=Effusibacillus dendaii TaxID=2743772 RepID=A0A7I8D7R7_9BACL|nr:ATP-binding protein [Effusibacillus dendaii]BCJ86154.1 sensor histidine kinase [Effusibacillus dendaii]
MTKKQIGIILLISLATIFLGELKMNPLAGGSFRFSLGTAAFFFGIIWFTSVSPIIVGLIVGAFVGLFRMVLTGLLAGGTWQELVQMHLPAVVFYIVFACILQLLNVRKRLDAPVLAGLIGIFAELLGNYSELLVRVLFGEPYRFGFHTLLVLTLFAVPRSFFVVGLYNMLMIRQLRAIGEEQQNRMDELLLINTNLYEEGIWLQKSMSHIEDITREGYELYRRLMQREAPSRDDSTLRGDTTSKEDGRLSQMALAVAQKVHEVKKDCQRILAGLSKIIQQETLAPRMPLQTVVNLVVGANQQYAEMLGKKIHFTVYTDLDLATSRIYGLISILNNLVANAVEAIEETGNIWLQTGLRDGSVEFIVEDDGPGIQEADRALIFAPGFTTKYDTQGQSSTGIGLSYVKHMVDSFGGSIDLECQPKTVFRVRIPTSHLLTREKEIVHEAASIHD